jgi:hypothetical protein
VLILELLKHNKSNATCMRDIKKEEGLNTQFFINAKNLQNEITVHKLLKKTTKYKYILA